MLPPGFVYLSDVDSSIIQDIRYFTDDNFIGRPITSYTADRCIATSQAAHALKDIQNQLKMQSLSLKVFDCYRPQSAVDDFLTWSQAPNDQKMKLLYYPNVNKADLFKLGYLAAKSAHSRGSTVDLTIVELPSKKELDMGTHFDFLDELSNTFSVQDKALENRLFLRNLMEKAGFTTYDKEWWHFTLKNEHTLISQSNNSTFL
jgi:zinc D-Ala-D-Ala dipeptidase